MEHVLSGWLSWSGHYEVMSPLWVTAHTTQFADVLHSDWHYLRQGHGSGELDFGGTFVSLLSTSPQKDTLSLQLTIVMETMGLNESLCIRSNPSKPWSVQPQNASFRLVNDAVSPWQLPSLLYVWRTLPFGAAETDWFESLAPIAVAADGSFTALNVPPNAVVTLTTEARGHKVRTQILHFSSCKELSICGIRVS